jgi:hypothetical protein
MDKILGRSYFTRNLKMAGASFRRNRLWFVLSIIAAILIAIPLIVILIVGASFGETMPGAMHLEILSRLMFYMQIFILCSSYEFFSRARSQDIAEVLSATTGGRPTYNLYLLLWQAGVVGLILLVPLAIILVPPIISGQQAYFLAYAWKPILVNVVLPSMISLLLAFVLAVRFSRLTAYGCMLVFIVLISPFAEGIAWSEQPQGLPIDQVFKYIRWPFTLLYNTQGGFAFDNQYGLQTEIPRWQVQFFWLLMLLGLSPLTLYLARKASLKRAARLLTLLLAATFLVLSYMPASLQRFSDNWDDSKGLDWNYYYHEPANSLLNQEAANASFKIAEYELSVKLRRQLAVDATLHLVADEPCSSFLFTLYHGYVVNDVSLDNGDKIDFAQEGDTLVLYLADAVQEATVRLSYAGSAGNLYSNSEACLLPGYFPWYPMAGEKRVWLGGSHASKGYNPYNRVNPATFKLRVSGVKSLVTNLSKNSDGSYGGVSDSVSLFTGHILPTGEPDITTWFPLQVWSKKSADRWQDLLRTSFLDSVNTLQEKYGLAADEFVGKRIISISNMLTSANNGTGIAAFDDYILLATTYVTPAELIYYYTDKEERSQSCFFLFFSQCIFEHAEEKGFTDLVSDRITEFEEAIVYFQEKSQPKTEEFKRDLALVQSFQEAIDKRGAALVMKKLQDYILDFDRPIDDQAFLDELLAAETATE